MGGLERAPQTPRRSERPGKAVVLLDRRWAQARHAEIIPGSPGRVDAWRWSAASSMLVSHGAPARRARARLRARPRSRYRRGGGQAAAPGADAVAAADEPAPVR